MSSSNGRTVITRILIVAVLCIMCALVMQCNGLIESVKKPVIQNQNTAETIVRGFERPKRVSSKKTIPSTPASRLEAVGYGSDTFSKVTTTVGTQQPKP